jgi:hypothetical protein
LTGSGIISGSVAVNGIVSPGNGVGALATGGETWAGGGHYKWEINSSAGTAGVNPGWDKLNIGGALSITANSGSTFTIDVTSLSLAGAPGTVSDFNNTTSSAWIIATASGGITGFDPAGVILNTNGFSNNIGSGVFSVMTNATDIIIQFTVAPSAQAPTNFVSTAAGQGSFQGSANTSYTVEFATNLTSPIVWQTLTNTTTDGAGVGGFNDPTAPSTQTQRYYRVRFP